MSKLLALAVLSGGTLGVLMGGGAGALLGGLLAWTVTAPRNVYPEAGSR